MAKYKVTIIDESGKVQNKTIKDAPNAELLIALELNTIHNGSVPFLKLLELAEGPMAARMGRQVAFCDEAMTIVVTDLTPWGE